MAFHLKVGGVWKNTSAVHIRVGGGWKKASQVWIKAGGVWKQLLATFSVSLSPGSVYAYSDTLTAPSGSCTVTPTPSGTYTYLWEEVASYSGSCFASGTTTNRATFRGSGGSYSGRWRVTVTRTSDSAVVAAELDVALDWPNGQIEA